jgi:hypothetical protein
MTLAPGDPRHGTTNGYNNLGCHCPACRTAWAAERKSQQAKRAARLALDPSIVPHGRASTYGNWGCRCRPCTDAWVNAMRSIPSKMKAKKAS